MTDSKIDETTPAIVSILNPLDGVEQEGQPEKEKNKIIFPVIMVSLITILSIMILMWASSNNKASLEENLEKRLNTVAVSQGSIIENLIAGQLNSGLEQVNNAMLRLVLSETSPQDGSPLLPRLQESIEAFRVKNRFHSTFVLTKESTTFLGSSKDEQTNVGIFRDVAQDIIRKGASQLKPLRIEDEKVYLDILHPIFEFQKASDSQKFLPVGVLVTTTDVTGIFARALKSTLEDDNATSLLVFPQEQGLMFLGDNGKVAETPASFILENIDDLLGQSFTNPQNQSYRKNAAIKGTAWFVIREADESVISDAVTQFNIFGGIIAFLFVVVISGVFMIVLLRQRSLRHKDLAHQYKSFAQKLQFQNKFIDTINKAIPDAVMLKDANGKMVYTNPAAETIFDLDKNATGEMTQSAVFDDESLKWVKQLDERALKMGQNLSEPLILNKGKEPKHLVISSIPFLEGEGGFEETNNILNVARDITDIVKSQNERIRMVEKTVMTLVSIIERRDPFLKGHSSQLAKLAMAIGKEMNLPGEEIRYLNYAGSLSQIGKTFISQEILTKTERLNDEEIQEMKKHIHYTIDTVNELDMPKSVVQGLSHMYERLDGSGYPEGLAGNQISLEGRILAIADILVARVSERSYRKAITVDTALQIFQDNPEKYDQDVTHSLANLCKTTDIQAMLNKASGSKPQS